MVAVVSGSGLGLFNSSASSLGGDNNGNAQVGRGRDRYYVNTTTGNLVIQSTDETLSAMGLDFAAVRTYNSQGVADDDNGDLWRLGVQRRLSTVTGGSGVNTAGSSITKTFGDGAEVVYTYNTTRARYESGDGDGANYFIVWNGSVWTWTDGSSRATEEYASISGAQRIRYSRDNDGLTVTYNYSGALLDTITMANPGGVANNAQTVTFTWGGPLNTNLQSIAVQSWDTVLLQMRPQTLTRYYYDSQNRLKQVVLDLSPGDNTVQLLDSNADGYYETSPYNTYVTTYTYEGNTKRLASIAQSDGSSVTFAYQELDGKFRLSSVTDAQGRVTTFAYSEVISSGGGTQSPATAMPGAPITNQDTQNLPYGINTNTLVRNEQQTTNVPHGLVAHQLTTPAGGTWGTNTFHDDVAPGSTAKTPRIGFDTNGNGVAVWAVTTGSSTELKEARYTRSTNVWTAATTLVTVAATSIDFGFDSATHGTAVVAWRDGTNIVARRFNGASWNGAQTVGTTSDVGNISVSVKGSHQAIAFGQQSAGVRHLFVSRWNGTGWTPPFSMDSATTTTAQYNVVTDGSGNVFASWTESSGTSLRHSRYTTSGGTWGAPVTVASGSAISGVQFALIGNGNGFLIWVQGTDLMMASYTRAGNIWTSPVVHDSLPGQVSAPALAIDDAGNAIVAWAQTDGTAVSTYARRYTVSNTQWSAATPLETSNNAVTATAGAIGVAINGTYAAVTWTQLESSVTNAYAATFNGTTWSNALSVESRAESASLPVIAVDSLGNATVMWQAASPGDLYRNRFTPGAGGSSYYLVPASATWQSIASTLYGINSTAAGAALQALFPAGQSIAQNTQLTRPPLPDTLQVPTTTTVPDYYRVPASPATPTWRSIAAVVYGIDSDAAGSALQTRMQQLFPGQYATLSTNMQIFGLPSTITVPTDITLPYYYHVVQSTSWATTLTTIYGLYDLGLEQAVQAYSGVTNLVVGTRLNVQPTQLYTPGGGSGTGTSIYQRTVVTDPLGTGFDTLYLKDSQGRLVSVQTPQVGGARIETRYTYDPATGNVATITEDPTGLNRVTTFTYDPNTGLLLNTRDSLGNTVARTYNTSNQLETETSHVGRDPDGAGSGQPSTPLTSRYIYDGENHLRFSISPDGRVTEHVYNPNGERITTYKYAANTYSGAYTESALNSWTTGTPNQRALALELIEYSYDFRNNISFIRKYDATTASGAGSGPAWTTHFVYDQRGQLIRSIEPQGAATTSVTNDFVTNYEIDGLGRTIKISAWANAIDGMRDLQTIQYQDLTRTTVTINAGGMTRTETYNASGERTSVALGPIAVGQTTYTYDANGRERVVSDSTGLKTYCFYDEAGRKIGYVDGDGTVSEYVYNRANEVIKTIRYATPLSSSRMTSLAGTGWSTTAFATLRSEANIVPGSNQVTRNVYDASGTLVYVLETLTHGSSETVAVTKNVYDGAGRLTDQFRYFNSVSIATGTSEVLPSAISIAEHATDRRTRFFYNAGGQLTGTLDATGFLKENVYDAAGRLVTQIGYFNPSDASRWATGTLDTLRPGSSGSVAQLDARDVRTRYFYDSQGRKTGELDGEKYLTEYVYELTVDGDGNRVQTETRWNRKLTDTGNTNSFATLKAEAIAPPTVTSHTTRYVYDGIGQLVRETNYENTETRYSYDVAGNLIATTRANGTAEARTTRARYDVLGRLESELTAEGAAVLALLPAGAPATDVNAVWNRYGMLYTYDNAGRRISATVRPNDAQINTTYYYYDNDGRVRFELDARGRVTENRFNGLGQLVDKIEYWRTIGLPSQLGGLLNTTLIGALTATESNGVHEKTTYAYSLRGEVLTTTTAAGSTTTKTYNKFGEVETEGAGSFTPLTYDYDTRGYLRYVRRNGVVIETRVYDAFGRLATVTDARNNTTTTTYDRLGRQVTSIQPGDANASWLDYDAFSRVITSRDKLLGTTSYDYVDATRTMTMRVQTSGNTAEDIVVVTARNRHGEDVGVTANGNTTIYAYDRDGRLTGVTDNLGAVEQHVYDRGGREIETFDARGMRTVYSYDAGNRMFRRVVDDVTGGLRLTTDFTFDPQNRVVTETAPGNRVTRTEYDRDGRTVNVYVDYGGPAQRRTNYTYDSADNQLTVTEFADSLLPRRTRYVYDTATGRRTDMYVEATDGTLSLRTQYKYDAADNVTRVIDSRNVSTWHVYDAQNRRTHTIDGEGGITQVAYDSEDRVVSTRVYTQRLGASTLAALATTDVPTTGHFSPTVSTNDQVERSFYDRAGRTVFSIDGVGTVTQRTFDDGGNVTRLRRISAQQLNGVYADAAAVATALGSAATSLAAADQVSWTAYDARGRAEFAVDSMNGVLAAVRRFAYDLNGNVISERAYYTARAISSDNTLSALQSWHNANVSASDDHVTLHWYDSVNRQRFVKDAEGYVTQFVYANATRATQTVRYATPQGGVTASLLESQVAGNISTSPNDQQSIVWVDATDRVRFALDAEGYLTETTYNDNTGAVTVTQYAAKPSTTPADTTQLATVSAYRVLTPTRDRSTTTWVDAANRQRFVLDAEGYLVETRYDNNTGSKYVYAYRTPQTQFNAASTLAQIATPGAIAIHAEDQSAREDYDKAGNLSQVTDSLSRGEFYLYDGAGNKTRFVNKNGSNIDSTAFAWTYQYDANGRLILETSPSVGVTTVTESGGTFTVQSDVNTPILTRTGYDFFGNIVSRVEAENIAGQVRTTRWEYDALGRQTATVSPTVGVYEVSGDSQTGGTNAVSRTETATEIRSEVAYDVFGNAFRNRRVRADQVGTASAGTFTYKAYDKLDRVVYDIDAKRQVVHHTLDAFGNDRVTTMFAAVRNNSPSPLPSTGIGGLRLVDAALGLTVNATTDRSITRTYDRMSRVLTSRQTTAWSYVLSEGSAPAMVQTQPLVENRYNAFGDIERMRELVLDGSPQKWANSYKYYDRRGMVTGAIDAAGYFTAQGYDAFGNRTSKTEYAQKNIGTIDETSFGTIVPSANGAALGSDRVVNYIYDRMNRLTREERINFEYGTSAGGTPSFTTAGAPRYTRYAYDALGNQTRMEDAMGGVTYNFYDVLGRVVAVASPLRDRGEGALAMGYTRMLRDAHGGLVQQTEYYNGLTSDTTGLPTGDAPALPTAPAAHATNDRVTTIALDKAGHATAMRDAVNAIRYSSYNERGDVAKDWQPVYDPNRGVTETRATIYRYDAVGQLTEKQDTQRTGVLVRRFQEYNAFGELTAAYNAGALQADREYFHYDQQGRLWRTNAGDGVDKLIMYDLAGRATLEVRSQTHDVGTIGWADASIALGALTTAGANLMRTETVYDIRGNAIEQRTPTFNTGTPAAIRAAVTGNVTVATNAAFPQPTQYFVSWTPDVTAQRAFFGYRVAGTTDAFTELEVVTPSGSLHGANVNELDNRLYEYRIAYFGGSDPMAVSETTGTFQLNRASSTSVTLPSSVNTQIPALLNSNHVNGYITWAAPSHLVVTARMRINGGVWIPATRPNSSTFQVDVRSAIDTAGNYTWDIEYFDWGTEPIAKKSGTLTSQVTRTLTPSGTQTINTPTPWGGTIGNPWASGTGASRTIGWNGPATLANEGVVVAELVYMIAGGGPQTTVNLAHNGSNAHTLNVSGLAANRYQYVLTYKVGGRQVAQQSGEFTTTDAYTRVSAFIDLLTAGAGGSSTPISNITGFSSGPTASWSNLQSEQVEQRLNQDTGFLEWYWNSNQWLRPTWGGSQASAWVRIEYTTLTDDPRTWTGLMWRDTDNGWTLAESAGYYDIADLPTGGCDSIQRLQVYTAEGGTLIGDSIGGVAERGITWSSPPGEMTGTAYVYYENGADNWVLIDAASQSADTFTIGTDVVPSGRRIKIEYTYPGDNWAYNTAIATYTYSPGSAPVLSGLTTSNHDPAMMTLDYANPNNGTLRWPATIASGGRLTVEIHINGNWQTVQTWSSGSSFSFDFAPYVSTAQFPPDLWYRIRNFGPASAPWPTHLAQGQLRAHRTDTAVPSMVTINDLATINSPSSPAATFNSNLTSAGLSWTRSKDASTDTVRLTYWRSGGTVYTQDLTGTGTGAADFSSNLPLLSDSSGTLFWHIDYYRTAPGHTNSYARSYGQRTLGVATVLSAQITAETPVSPTYRASDRALVLTSPATSLADVRVWIVLPPSGQQHLTVLADGAGYKALLPNILPNGSYLYTVEYRNASGQLYGKASGTIVVSTTLGTISSSTVTKSSVERPETTLEIGVNIGRRVIIDPPYAFYQLADGGFGSDLEELPDWAAAGAAPWGASTEIGGGGWFYSPGARISGYPPDFDHLAQNAYHYYTDHFTISWERDDREGYEYQFEYWAAGNPSVVSTLNVVGPDATYWAVDVNHLSGTYGWRITRRHAGSPIVLGTREGTFTRGGTNNVTVSAPTYLASANVTPVTRQEYDRWDNVVRSTDTAGNQTRFRYNSLDQMVQITEASDLVFDRRENSTGQTPTVAKEVATRTYYDLLGRVIEARDGYDQATRATYNLAGQLLTQRNADSASFGDAVARNVYDIFGNVVQTTDQLGFITRNKYDAIGRLTEVLREIQLGAYASNNALNLQKTTYVYDAAGRRITETNNANEVTEYDYDLAGNIVSRDTPTGETTYQYDQYNNQIEEIDAIGGQRSWTYDAFKRVQTHIELRNSGSQIIAHDGGGLTVRYTYDEAGMLKWQRHVDAGGNYLPGRQSITYNYDGAGHTQSIVDGAVGRTTSYRYDAAGRQMRETVVVNGILHQDTRVTYDAHNRIKNISDPDYALNIIYDVNGNRAQLRSAFNGGQRGETENIDYEYDEMNRVTRTVIDFSGLPVVGREVMEEEFEYNARGERTKRIAQGQYWGLRANGQYETYPTGLPDPRDPIEEIYHYDGLGRVEYIERDLVTTSGKVKRNLHEYTYDAVSRVKTDYALSIEGTQLVKRKTTNVYLTDGRLDTQEVLKGVYGESDGALDREQLTTYGRADRATNGNNSYGGFSIGFDDAGNLRGYKVNYFEGTDYETVFRSRFHLGDGYLESAQNADSNRALQNGNTARTYDANHHMIRFEDLGSSTPVPSKRRDLAYNQAGQVLTAMVGTPTDLNAAWDVATRFSQTGISGSGGVNRFFYWQNQQLGSFGPGQADGLYKAKFDTHSTSVSGYSDVPASVVAQTGDTLRIIAGRIYGDSSLWYVIAQENGLADPDEMIAAGTQLRLPNKVTSISNTSDSFRPFDLGEALGSMTPTQKPRGLKCQTFSQILGIIVSLVVMFYTAGAGGLAQVGTSAGAGGAGNLVTQYSSLMFNDMFDWKAMRDGMLTSAGLKGNFWDAAQDWAVEGGKGILSVGGTVDYWLSSDRPSGAAMSIYDPFAHGAPEMVDRQSAAISAASAAASAATMHGVSSMGEQAAGSARAAGASSSAITAIERGYAVAGAGLGAAAGYATQYTMNRVLGRETHFSWRDIAFSAVSAMAGSYAGRKFGSSAFESGVISGVVSTTIQAFNGGKMDPIVLAADIFGNAIATSILERSAITESEEQRILLADNSAVPGTVVQGDPEVERRYMDVVHGLYGQETEGSFKDKEAHWAILNQGVLDTLDQVFDEGGRFRVPGGAGAASEYELELSKFMQNAGLTPTEVFEPSGTSYPASIPSLEYTEQQVFEARRMVGEAMKDSYRGDVSVPAHRLLYAVKSKDGSIANTDELFWGGVSRLGGYAEAAGYTDFYNRVSDVDANHLLVDVSFIAAQSDARATAAAKSRAFYKWTESANKFTRGMLEQSAIMNPQGLAGAYLAHMATSDWVEVAKNVSFVGDPLAPGALRDNAQSSLFVEAAFAAPTLIGGVGVTIKAARTLKSMATLNGFRSVQGLDLEIQGAWKGTRSLPKGNSPWIKYQKLVTDRDFEETWMLDNRIVELDARRMNFTVEAKWGGKDSAAFLKSPYNPTSKFYDESKILSQASRQVRLDKAIGGKGVRYAVSNDAMKSHFDRIFGVNFPAEIKGGQLRVYVVPGNGM